MVRLERIIPLLHLSKFHHYSNSQIRIYSLAFFYIFTITIPFTSSAENLSDAINAYHNNNLDKAVLIAEPIAENGDIASQNFLGSIFSKQGSKPQDYNLAFYWFEKAANQGSALAQYNLGILYKEGLGVYKDRAKAFKWTKIAAEQGHALSQLRLSRFYILGEGVTADLTQAFQWMRKVKWQDKGSKYLSYEFSDIMTSDETPNYTMLFLWLNLAENNGNSEAINLKNILILLMSDLQIEVATEMAKHLN